MRRRVEWTSVYCVINAALLLRGLKHVKGDASSHDGDKMLQGIYSYGENYRRWVQRAMCVAHCLQQHGSFDDVDPYLLKYMYNDDYVPPYLCSTVSCSECQKPCLQPTFQLSECQETCETHTCYLSCTYLDDLFKEKALTFSAYNLTFSRPTIACRDIPRKKTSGQFTASVYIRWSEKDHGMRSKSPTVFVVDIRTKSSDGTMSRWFPATVRRTAFMPITGLYLDAQYQLRILPVMHDGVCGNFSISEWFTTLNEKWTLSAPYNGSTVHQFLSKGKVNIVVEWKQTPEQHCFYKLSLLEECCTSLSSTEYTISQPQPRPRYLLRNLDFSAVYTLKLSHYVVIRGKEHIGPITDIMLRTGGCLSMTNNSFTICPPGKVQNFSGNTLMNVLPNVSTATVVLNWTCPLWTSLSNRVHSYSISWRKWVPYHLAPNVRPHHGEIILTENATSYVINGLYVNELYQIDIQATSEGGPGEKEYVTVNTTAKDFASFSIITPGERQSSLVHIVSGTVTSVVVMMVLLPLVKYAIWRHRKNKLKHRVPKVSVLSAMSGNPLYSPLEIELDDAGRTPLAADEYEVSYDSIVFFECIGQGAFGKVMRAHITEWSSSLRYHMADVSVAVKTLKDYASQEKRRNFLLEIEMMKQLGRHPNIVSIVGACTVSSNPCLIMDYCPLGDLRNHLKSLREQYPVLQRCLPLNSNEKSGHYNVGSRSSGSTSYTSDSGVLSNKRRMSSCPTSPGSSQITAPGVWDSHSATPSDDSVFTSDTNRENGDPDEEKIVDKAYYLPVKLLNYARQITMGMEYLSQNKFVHRDLAARNVLLSDDDIVKISDFGLARDIYEESMYRKNTAGKLPIKWMSIEAIFDQVYTIKSDVWSFGVLLWELVTLGGTPYPGVANQDLYRLLKDGYRMEKPDNCSPELYEIMLACWHPDPLDRPRFTALRHKLDHILEMSLSSRHAYKYMDLSVAPNKNYYSAEMSGSDEGALHCIEDNEETGSEHKVDVHCPDDQTSDEMKTTPTIDT